MGNPAVERPAGPAPPPAADADEAAAEPSSEREVVADPDLAPALVGGVPLPRRRRLRIRRRRLVGLVVPACLVGLWQLAISSGWISRRILPSPWSVAVAGRDFFAGPAQETLPGVVPFRGAATQHLSASVTRWLAAYALACAVGLAIGLGIGLSRRVADLIDPVVQALRSIPIFAWLPLALVWFGLGEGSARYLVFIGALWPIVVATGDAVSRVPRAYVETALMLGTRRRALARKVYVPAALPGIVTGLRLGMTLGWMSVIVAELTGTRRGIGAMMNAARETGRLDQILVGMVCFALVGLIGDYALRGLTRRYVAWNDA
ncbi:MAG TPA: ABC transporter permease [Acidimicrobiales bacterium]|nr:ABC transporter permease [Acidimicrobiales bacterium]